MEDSDIRFLCPGDMVYVTKDKLSCSAYLKMYTTMKIGAGGFGTVYHGKHVITQEEVAIKIIHRFNFKGANATHKIFQEAKVL